MQSSTGQHFIALDHVRAMAAFMVFAWHFAHGPTGYPVPFQFTPDFFPLALLDEGHVGVALFMTLSGYLFAKLINQHPVHYRAFLWNRLIRLVPLLVVVILVNGVLQFLQGQPVWPYARSVVQGLVLPSLPNGGWSITVELHYYLFLPLLLWLFRRSLWWPIGVVAVAITGRALLHNSNGEVQSLAYWTLLGRIDQFVLGMMAFYHRRHMTRRHVWMGIGFLLFSAFYWDFDARGGFMLQPSYPSPSPIWIVLPSLEGFFFAIFIAWYDTSFTPGSQGISKWVGWYGKYSYSIYLLHFYVVFEAARLIDTHVRPIAGFYWAMLFSLVTFALMLPLGYLSYRFVESPFLKRRRSYLGPLPAAPQGDRSATGRPR